MTHQQDEIGIMQRFIGLQNQGIFPWGSEKYTVQLRKMLYTWMAKEIVTTETKTSTSFGYFQSLKTHGGYPSSKVSHVNQSLLEWWTQQAKKSEIVLFPDFSFSDFEEEDLGLEEEEKDSQELEDRGASSPKNNTTLVLFPDSEEEEEKDSQELEDRGASSPKINTTLPPPQYNYQVGDSGDELHENEDSGKDAGGEKNATGGEKNAGEKDATGGEKNATGGSDSKVKYGTFFRTCNKDKKMTLNMDNFGGKKDYWIGEPSSMVFDADAKTGDKIHVGYLVGGDYVGNSDVYDLSDFKETLPLDFKNIEWYFRCCGMCKKKVNHANDIVMKEITINGMKYWRSTNDWRPMFIDDRQQIGTGHCFLYGRKYVGMLMEQ